MNLLTRQTSFMLWEDVIKSAENHCAVSLKKELESYLISLLMRYINKPGVTTQILATAFLKALHEDEGRQSSLQSVGDHCLLFVGLFPHLAEKRLVKINYFVDLGRSAYATISHTTNDLYSSLALQFVVLMDVLQSIRVQNDLLPLEAYELWNEVGSQRALKILQTYSHGIPFKFLK